MTNRNNPFGEGYLTAEQKEHQARAWAETSPNASAARKEILRIVSEAPIHTQYEKLQVVAQADTCACGKLFYVL